LETKRQSLETALQEQMLKLTAARRRLQQIQTLRDRALAEHNFGVDRELEQLALESHLARRVTSMAPSDIEAYDFHHAVTTAGKPQAAPVCSQNLVALGSGVT
jgi:hypothetical protein